MLCVSELCPDGEYACANQGMRAMEKYAFPSIHAWMVEMGDVTQMVTAFIQALIKQHVTARWDFMETERVVNPSMSVRRKTEDVIGMPNVL